MQISEAYPLRATSGQTTTLSNIFLNDHSENGTPRSGKEPTQKVL